MSTNRFADSLWTMAQVVAAGNFAGTLALTQYTPAELHAQPLLDTLWAFAIGVPVSVFAAVCVHQMRAFGASPYRWAVATAVVAVAFACLVTGVSGFLERGSEAAATAFQILSVAGLFALWFLPGWWHVGHARARDGRRSRRRGKAR